jgi:cobalt-zinc-cadmium efflux system outer membrane protein
MRYRSVLGIVLFAVFTAPADASAPEQTAQLTLPEAVQLALRTNPSIRAKQREHEATRAGETTAGLLPNPTASYLAEQLGSSGVSPQYTVSVSQTIETGGKRSRRVESARAATRVSELEFADVRRQVIAQVKKTCWSPRPR